MKRIGMLYAGAAVAMALLVPAPAMAGQPLTCHPLEIGQAKSLPFVERSWDSAKEPYDVSRLVRDTEELLTPETPVLVRMETLRRAAIWSTKDLRIAPELIRRLAARAHDPLTRFDAGYLIETYRQLGLSKDLPALAEDGYAMIRKALEARGDPAMEFAAALVTVWDGARRGPHPNHREHLRKAVAGAAEGSLLAKNLAARFGQGATTIAELRAKVM